MSTHYDGFCTDCGSWTAVHDGRCGCGSGRVALPPASFSIVHKDEMHAPSVERAIAVALAEPEMPGEPPEAVLKSMLEAGPVETARAACRATKSGIADALRELMKEVGRG